MFCTFTLALSVVCLQCQIWLFYVVRAYIIIIIIIIIIIKAVLFTQSLCCWARKSNKHVHYYIALLVFKNYALQY
jgi:hypothetical protein